MLSCTKTLETENLRKRQGVILNWKPALFNFLQKELDFISILTVIKILHFSNLKENKREKRLSVISFSLPISDWCCSS